MELKDLLGRHYLSGVSMGTMKVEDINVNTVDFILDGETITVSEDPSDGYRSSMNEIFKNRKNNLVKNTFDNVEVIGTFRSSNTYEDYDIIDFIDCITGKVILSVGTANTNDYYPYFVGDWCPQNMCHNIDK